MLNSMCHSKQFLRYLLMMNAYKFPEQKTIICNQGDIHVRKLHAQDTVRIEKFIKKNSDRFKGPFPITTAQVISYPGAKKWLKVKLNLMNTAKGYYLIGINETKEIVVCFFVFNIDWRVPKCEVSWMLDYEYEGQGIAGRMAELVCEFLLNTCGMRKILARIDPKNTKSIQLAVRTQFQREARMKKDFRNGFGEILDVDYYSIIV